MPTRDPRTGRYVSTANTPEASVGKFQTYADDMPAVVQGAEDFAYATEPRHGPSADELAQGYAGRLEPRHPALVGLEEHAATLYGAQGSRMRDAARLHGVAGPIGHALGLEPPVASPEPVQRRDGSGARLPSMYARPDVEDPR